MSKLSYAKKFGLIFVLMIIPLSFLLLDMVTDSLAESDFIRKERVGLEYIKEVRIPIEYIQQHRGMTAAYLGGAEELSLIHI